ncbi:MAG TPA: ribosomal RNA small subunit methyltransferase A [Bacteroidetes bacterium]|nr:ribosomal RNA small subunit methyltransferase A [Bacteroidota bacterium]
MLPPKKSLGQHFLRDENIARNIVDSLELRPADFLVEIGPGQGALTKHLVGRTAGLTVIEVDERAIHLLRDSFGDAITIVHADVRTVSLGEIARSGRLRVVGNIPYNITSEILFWLFDAREHVGDATLMVQLEVAQRFVAKKETKAYGILSIYLQLYAETELLFRVSRNSFFPRPDVDSAIVRLRFNHDLPQFDEHLFRAIVRGTFGKRRKTLRNGLRFMGFTDDQLDGCTLDLSRRPENLVVEDFLELTRQLKKLPESNQKTE